MDEERILGKIDQLDQYLNEIEEDMPEGLEDYRKERRKYERLLHLCIETVIDISALILKSEGLGAPSNEESIIERLAEADILDQDFAGTLKQMKGFRNILVHRYGEINDRKVYENLDNLEDFYRFRDKVMNYLE